MRLNPQRKSSKLNAKLRIEKKILEYIIDSMLDKKYKSQIEKSQNTQCVILDKDKIILKKPEFSKCEQN